jgi:hypothetical protein
MLTQIMLWIKSLGLSEEAQGLAEYALILVLIAVVVILTSPFKIKETC